MTDPQSQHPFLQAIAQRTVLVDGAMGTMLYEQGVFITQCFEQQNLKKPHLVREIHAAYAHAGAEVLEANTFGANRVKLAHHGIEQAEMEEIIRAGVALAREAGGAKIWVAGSMGPAGLGHKGEDPFDPALASDVFAQHATLLREAGVDLMILETFRDLAEMELALAAVRSVAPGLPVLTFVSPNGQGTLDDGTPLPEIARRMQSWGVTAGGFNDGAGPDGMLRLMKEMKQAAPGLSLAAMPFIGGTETIEDRSIHLATSEFTGVYTRRMQREGVKVLGLCCGATPAHTRAMRNALRALQPGQLSKVGQSKVAIATASEQTSSAPLAPAATRFGQKIEAGQFAVSVEIDPPQGTDVSKAMDSARALHASGRVDAINIADGPRATARVNPASMALLLQREVGIEAIIHYCCRDRNLLGMQADLLGANSLGLLNVLCITGDPPKMGDYPDATAVFDVDAIGLTQIVSRLNRGQDLAGNPIGAPTHFFNGVGANPATQDLDTEIERLARKHEAGARYVMTQPVYDSAVFERFMERVAPIGIPVLIGICPLASLRNARFLHNNVPGMAIPTPIMARMEKYEDPADQRKEGLDIAREALLRARPQVQGTYIMPPFGSAKLALAVLEALGEPTKSV